MIIPARKSVALIMTAPEIVSEVSPPFALSQGKTESILPGGHWTRRGHAQRAKDAKLKQ
jgi:hypothetical protein